MRKLVLLGIAVCFVVMALGVAAFAEEKKEIHIGVTIPGLFSPAFVEMKRQGELKAQELGVKVTVVSAENDIDRQFEQVRDFIAAGVDGIVITTIDSYGIVKAIEEANKAGIPVITVDRKSFGGEVFYHEETDNFNAGRLCAVYVAHLFKDNPGPIEIFIERLDPSVDSVEDRFQGFMFEVSQWPNLKVVAAPNLGMDVGKAFEATINAFQANPNIKVIFLPGEPWLSGTVSALKQLGKWFPRTDPNHIVMVGVDGDQFAVENMIEGYYDFSAVQAIDKFVANAIEVFVQYFREGKKPPVKERYVPVLGLCPENFDFIKDRVWGYRVYMEQKGKQ